MLKRRPMNRTTIAILTASVSFFLPFNHVAQAQDAADGGISDSQIHSIVERVAKHQIHPLAEGDYSVVTNLGDAKAAKEPEGIMWSYPWGVTLYGMEHEADAFGDADAAQFVTRHNLICANYYHWLAGLEKEFGDDGKAFARTTKIKPLISLGTLDSCGAMGNEILENMMQNPNNVTPEEKEVVARIADWVVHKQDRMTNSTLWRPKVMGGTVWPDDLYMGGVFLVRWGIYNHDQKFIDDAAEQIIHQAALEQDSDGLWFHGYFVSKDQHAPFKWGRGNGWVTVTLVETLSAMDDKDPLKPQLIDILKKQVDGLKKVQAPDGMWRQVLDKQDLWEETSCTAMFAYGIARAVNRGWIDADNMAVARKAFAGIAHHVTSDGVVKGTCQGTNIGTDFAYYVQRPRPDDDLHGRGPVMLAGLEILSAKK
jgi:unsaturated rhamnogalacturonyl hydrolase